jgi:hypothetical protein
MHYPTNSRRLFNFDSRIDQGIGSIQETDRPLLYIPDLAPVGSGSAYFPRSVDDDAVALNVLGFGAGFPGGGSSQRADMANEEGAWDSSFRAAVTNFQKQNPALRAPGVIPGLPPVPAPLPGGKTSPAPGKVVPVVPGGPEDNTTRNLMIGGGVLAVLVGGYFLLK